MKRGFVLISKELGIYLGNAMGLGFWSKLDPVNQPSAITFESTKLALEHAETWDNQLEDLSTCEVDVDDPQGYASRDSCVNAGLESWNIDVDKLPEPDVTIETARAAMNNIAMVHCLDPDWNTMMAFIDQTEKFREQVAYAIRIRRCTPSVRQLVPVPVVTTAERIRGIADDIVEEGKTLGLEPPVPPELKHGEEAKDPEYGKGVFSELSGLVPPPPEES